MRHAINRHNFDTEMPAIRDCDRQACRLQSFNHALLVTVACQQYERDTIRLDGPGQSLRKSVYDVRASPTPLEFRTGLAAKLGQRTGHQIEFPLRDRRKQITFMNGHKIFEIIQNDIDARTANRCRTDVYSFNLVASCRRNNGVNATARAHVQCGRSLRTEFGVESRCALQVFGQVSASSEYSRIKNVGQNDETSASDSLDNQIVYSTSQK